MHSFALTHYTLDWGFILDGFELSCWYFWASAQLRVDVCRAVSLQIFWRTLFRLFNLCLCLWFAWLLLNSFPLLRLIVEDIYMAKQIDEYISQMSKKVHTPGAWALRSAVPNALFYRFTCCITSDRIQNEVQMLSHFPSRLFFSHVLSRLWLAMAKFKISITM